MTRALGIVLVFAPLVACHEPLGPAQLVHGQVLTVEIMGPRPHKPVDILFVIDDSLSMADEQANLAANFHAFIEVLEVPWVAVDYRIAVTTTDAGNPRCLGDAAARGAFVAQPCSQRLDDFVVGEVDLRELACTDVCTLTDAELEIVPTTTETDSIARPRPWLENIEGRTNLPAGVDMAEAFACLAPQGIAGCEFEAPLESMMLALDRTLDGQDPAYGFLRPEAITLIIFITDGHDCSYAEDWADIFAPEGSHVFWSDPAATAPTPAVCWNAGVECVGDPSHYDACVAVDKDVEGQLTSSEDRAVLKPVQHYVERLQGYENIQQEFFPHREVIVSLVAGIGTDSNLHYADADDPEFQDEYGIGPGCTQDGGPEAVPPVRLLEFAEAFTPDNVFSICDPDYTPALQALAWKLVEGSYNWPACFRGCVQDSDRYSEVIEPDCWLEQRAPGQNEWLEECRRSADGSYSIDPDSMNYAMPNDDVDVCYAMLVDSGGETEDPADDMSPECTDLNYNLEFKISRRPGFPGPSDARLVASCSLSDYPQVDCPNLGEAG